MASLLYEKMYHFKVYVNALSSLLALFMDYLLHFTFNLITWLPISWKRACERYYFAINFEKFVNEITDACDVYVALQSVPRHMISPSSSEPPAGVGVSFAVDVLKRYKQLVLIMRETVSSCTASMFISDECKTSLRSHILVVCLSSLMTGIGNV